MVLIRQHGNKGELFDIATFLADVNKFMEPDNWLITIACCLGERAVEIEQLSFSGLTIPDAEFQSLYRGIYQTIDGHFIGIKGGDPIFSLLAVDSSFWEVTGSPAFESHMLETYGAWQRA